MYLKVLNDDGSVYHHSGSFRWPLPVKADDGTWTPGEWIEVGKRAKKALTAADLCTARVLHVVRPDQLIDWLGPAIFEVEVDESRGVIVGPDKIGCRRARLLRRIETWNERTARHFACDCAEDALQYAGPEERETLECAIYVARCYADGEATEQELYAAQAAAWDAAQAAAWDAARDAAWAAQDAAWDAARAAARAAQAAAWDAARDAAWAAARDAAWDAHSKNLISMLREDTE